MVRPGEQTRKPRVKLLASRSANGVDGLPRDEHGHHGGLSRASRQLQREAHQLWVCIPVGRSEVLKQRLPALHLGGDFGQPDRSFHRLDLAERTDDTAEGVVPPVLEKAGGFRGDQPLVGVGQRPPGVHVAAHIVDKRGGVVLLLLCREPFAFVEYEVSCSTAFFRFFGFGIGVMNSARRRRSTIRWVGCPLSSSSSAWSGPRRASSELDGQKWV